MRTRCWKPAESNSEPRHPPCKRFSALANINRVQYGEESLAPNLIPEFERCVTEAEPSWFLMENVRRAPLPCIEGFDVRDYIFNNRWFGGEQNRERRFSFGTATGAPLLVDTQVFEPTRFEPAVTGNNGGRRAVLVRDESGRVRGKQGDADWHRLHRRSIARISELQGLPGDYLDVAPFTTQGKREVLANGVPLPMGRAIAKAVREATEAVA